MARRAEPTVTAKRSSTNAARTSGQSPSAAAITAATTTTRPTTTAPSPTQRRGGRSVISHHPPAPATATPTTTPRSAGRLRTANTTRITVSSEPAADGQPGQRSLTSRDNRTAAPCSCLPSQRRRHPFRHSTSRDAWRRHTDHVIRHADHVTRRRSTPARRHRTQIQRGLVRRAQHLHVFYMTTAAAALRDDRQPRRPVLD